MQPKPMDGAPPGDGWVLGLVQAEDDTQSKRQPWAIVSRCDDGWMDDDGNSRSPAMWVPLPDPQPEGTGWRPVEGTILVCELSGDGWTCNGKPVTVTWRWSIQIERLDGSYDAYRDCIMRDTLEQAEREALKWQEKYGLPIALVPLDRKVVSFHPRPTRQ